MGFFQYIVIESSGKNSTFEIENIVVFYLKNDAFLNFYLIDFFNFFSKIVKEFFFNYEISKVILQFQHAFSQKIFFSSY